MKNPHPMSSPWNRSVDPQPVLIPAPGPNKKFKRKSREPKRLFSGPEPERIRTYLSDEDSQTEGGGEGRLAHTTGVWSGPPEPGVAPAQTGAIDMRIGINVPTITSKLSQLAAPPFSSEISHWPPAISQPLSNRLKVGLRPSFPLSTSSSSSSSSLSPGQQTFSLEAPLCALPVPRTPHHAQQGHHPVDPQVHSPQESPKKRAGGGTEGGTDGHGHHHPEVKAVQQTRRLLANARERTRVHTISAAFEALRKQVPCYSYGQKLSKLAILRIACNYILSLAQLTDLDLSPDHPDRPDRPDRPDHSLTFSQCVEQCTRTLQAEGRSKKRKVGRIPEDV